MKPLPAANRRGGNQSLPANLVVPRIAAPRLSRTVTGCWSPAFPKLKIEIGNQKTDNIKPVSNVDADAGVESIV